MPDVLSVAAKVLRPTCRTWHETVQSTGADAAATRLRWKEMTMNGSVSIAQVFFSLHEL